MFTYVHKALSLSHSRLCALTYSQNIFINVYSTHVAVCCVVVVVVAVVYPHVQKNRNVTYILCCFSLSHSTVSIYFFFVPFNSLQEKKKISSHFIFLSFSLLYSIRFIVEYFLTLAWARGQCIILPWYTIIILSSCEKVVLLFFVIQF